MKQKNKTIKGDLILKKDFKFDGNLIVEGNIVCENGRWNIDALSINAQDIDAGNINARNIDAWDIDARNINAGNINAWNINARNIDAGDIDARNIDARNIDAGDIVCESRKKKDKSNKTIARVFITAKSKIEKKQHD